MAQEHGRLVKCPSCGSSTTLLLAADGTYRCRFCAKPIVYTEGLPIVTEKATGSMADASPALCGLAAVAICILFLPVILWMIFIPLAFFLCFGLSRKGEEQNTPAAEESSIL